MKRLRSPSREMEDTKENQLVWNTATFIRQFYWSLDGNNTEFLKEFIFSTPDSVRDFLFTWKPNYPFDRVPEETIWKIFQILDPDDFYQCLFVCSRWREIIGLHMHEIGSVEYLERIGLKAMQYFPHIQKLCVPLQHVDAEDLSNVLLCCTNLKELDLSSIQTTQNDNIDGIEPLATIQVEKISISTASTFRIPTCQLLQKSTTLTDLCIHSLQKRDKSIHNWLETTKYWKAPIKKLTLMGSVQDKAFTYLSRATALQELILDYTEISTSSIDVVIKKLPSLHTLYLCQPLLTCYSNFLLGCTQLRNLTVKTMSSSCSLKFLNHLSFLTDLSLEAPLSQSRLCYFKNLKMLQKLSYVTNDSVTIDYSPLSNYIPQLKHLTLLTPLESFALPHLTELESVTLEDGMKEVQLQIHEFFPQLKSLYYLPFNPKKFLIEDEDDEYQPSFDDEDDY